MKNYSKIVLPIVIGLIIIAGVHCLVKIPFIFIMIILLPVIIGLVNYPIYRQSFILAVIYGYTLYILVYYANYLYPEGYRSHEGDDAMNIYTFVSLVIATVAILIYAFVYSIPTENTSKLRSFLKKVVLICVCLITATIIINKIDAAFYTPNLPDI